MAKARKAGTLLVGDVGGTNTRLALYDAAGRRRLAEVVRKSHEHQSFEEIALAFLAKSSDLPMPSVAVIGVAGPIQKGTARITNLAWVIEEKALEKRLAVQKVVLLNDLVAAAHGCLHAPPGSLLALTETRPAKRRANLAVIAAGTGLGEARLVWTGETHLALGTEGGHADFAPRSPLEIELWHFLASRYPDHVSYERVLSGDGLGALYDFFAARARRTPRDVDKRLAEGDRNVAIGELGLARAFRPAAKAVDAFVAIYGAEAGNLALRELALGGVFVSGNIGRSLVPARREIFLEHFRKKGRFSPMMAQIPVAVVTDTTVGVRGALAVARSLAGS